MWIRPCTMTASHIATYLSREGPETLRKTLPFLTFFLIPIYLARGRKLVYVKKLISFISLSIDTYQPREGPET